MQRGLGANDAGEEKYDGQAGTEAGKIRTESLAGKTFGLWKILEDGCRYRVYPPTPTRKYAQRVRLALAECLGCGNIEEVIWQSLVNGRSLSCRICSSERAGLARRKPYRDLAKSQPTTLGRA
jgi:hypothetical protein